jgi:hypothetical protein
MRRWLRLAACFMACSGLCGCATPEDTAYSFAFTPPPPESAPEANRDVACSSATNPQCKANGGSPLQGNGGSLSGGNAVLQGQPTKLGPRQQEAVVAGVSRWLKKPKTAQFGIMQAVRDPRGVVTVCGWVDGHNGAGVYRGQSPYIGVLTPMRRADFIVVGIGGTRRERADVLSLCKETGALKAT